MLHLKHVWVLTQLCNRPHSRLPKRRVGIAYEQGGKCRQAEGRKKEEMLLSVTHLEIKAPLLIILKENSHFRFQPQICHIPRSGKMLVNQNR